MINAIIYILFTLSGFAGLIYESIWARYLKLFLGHAAYGQILTLIIYMGGLGLGAYLFGKYVRNMRRPLMMYAYLELAIGLGGLLYHPLYHYLTEGFFNWIVQENSLPFWILNVLKLGLVFLITAPWAILLGGTFPCLTVALIRLKKDGGRSALPWLYFTNSMGGAIGILFGSYYLLVQSGTEGSLNFACFINLGLALAFLLLSKGLNESQTYSSRLSNIIPSRDNFRHANLSKVAVYLLLLTSCFTGFASFIYEIGWIRLLSLLLGSSTHSFDIMVSAFIFGLAWGGIFAHFLLRSEGKIWLSLALIQMIMGVLAASSLLGYDYLFYLVNQSGQVLTHTPAAFIVFNGFKYIISLLLMFPASFCAGTTLPLITWLILNKTHGEEKWVGYVYSWNTLGAILGSALGGLYLLPLFQLKGFIIFGALIDLSLGALLLFYLPGQRPLKLGGVFASLLLLIPTLITPLNQFVLSSGVFLFRKELNLQTLQNPRKKIQVNHGKTATISTAQTKYHIGISTNGKTDASIFTGPAEKNTNTDEYTQAALALYPMRLFDKPYRCAVIGMGSGITAHYLLADPQLQHLDLIEIEPKMYEMARIFLPYNQRVYESPKIKVHFEDAKTYFYQAPEKYDLIVSEPSNPWVSGVSSLFTQEFYQNMKKFLTSEGVLVQWIHTYEFNQTLMLSILKALGQEFKYIELYGISELPLSQKAVTKTSDLIILASNHPIKQKFSPRLNAISQLQDDLKRFGAKTEDFDKRHYLTSLEPLKILMKDIPVNSDYHPYVDHHAEEARYTKQKVDLLDLFLPHSPAIYPSLFEKDYLKHREQILQNSPRLIQAVLQSRSKLQEALKHSPPQPISHQAFYQNLYQLYPFLNWQASQSVQLYQAYLDKMPTPAAELKMEFAVLKMLKIGTTAQQRQALNLFLSQGRAYTWSPDLLRLLITHSLREKWEIETQELLKYYILPHQQYSEVEKTYLKRLFETRILGANLTETTPP